MSDYLTDKDVAEKIGKSPAFVQAHCRTAQWPHLRVGKSYRFKAEHVAAIEALFEVKPKPATAERSWGLAPGRRS